MIEYAHWRLDITDVLELSTLTLLAMAGIAGASYAGARALKRKRFDAEKWARENERRKYTGKSLEEEVKIGA